MLNLLRPASLLVIAAAIATFIYGCAGRQPEPIEPAFAPLPAHEVGRPHVTTASWYGPGLDGHTTSSGETFHQNAMTAASTSLPLGSHARVTNLATGRSVIVRINDRGPFVRGRGIDLSRGAAQQIGLNRSGVAKVRVTRVDGPSGEVGESWAGTVDVKRASSPSSGRRSRTRYASRTVTTPVAATSDAAMVSNPVGSWLMEMVTPSH